MSRNHPFCGISLTVLVLLASVQSSLAVGAYTEAQAATGKKAFDQHCASCHSITLRGSAHGSELTGQSFMAKWGSRTTSDLVRYNRANMPPGISGSLSEADHLTIIAHILKVNGLAAGTEELRADMALVINSGEVAENSQP